MRWNLDSVTIPVIFRLYYLLTSPCQTRCQTYLSRCAEMTSSSDISCSNASSGNRKGHFTFKSLREWVYRDSERRNRARTFCSVSTLLLIDRGQQGNSFWFRPNATMYPPNAFAASYRQIQRWPSANGSRSATIFAHGSSAPLAHSYCDRIYTLSWVRISSVSLSLGYL